MPPEEAVDIAKLTLRFACVGTAPCCPHTSPSVLGNDHSVGDSRRLCNKMGWRQFESDHSWMTGSLQLVIRSAKSDLWMKYCICVFVLSFILPFCYFCLAAFPFLTFILSSFHIFIYPVLVSLFIPFSLLYFYSFSLDSFCPSFFSPLYCLYIFALPVERLFCFFHTSPHAGFLSVYQTSCFILSNLLTLSFHVWFRFGLFLAFFIYFLVVSFHLFRLQVTVVAFSTLSRITSFTEFRV